MATRRTSSRTNPAPRKTSTRRNVNPMALSLASPGGSALVQAAPIVRCFAGSPEVAEAQARLFEEARAALGRPTRRLLAGTQVELISLEVFAAEPQRCPATDVYCIIVQSD